MEHNSKVRSLTSIVYVAVVVGFFALKIFVNDLCFDVLILLFAAGGTFEILRAFGEKLLPSQKAVVMVFSLLNVASYAVGSFVWLDLLGKEGAFAVYVMLFTFAAGAAVLFGIAVFAHESVSLESVGSSLVCYLYPGAFLVALTICNHLTAYSDAAVALVFVVCPLTDSLAYVAGKLFGRKFPAKMSPVVSPNKTIVGGIGGLIGGAVGAVGVFFLYYGVCLPVAAQSFGNVSFEWIELVFYVCIGIVLAVFAQFGDLVESAVKRKFGIKDMGNLLPGHGGVLDRIDSSLYVSVIVAFVFFVRIMAGI